MIRALTLTLATVLAVTAPVTVEARGRPDVEAIIRDVWPDHVEDAAIRVAWCESRHIPTARNRWGFRGLFQMGPREWRRYGHGGNIYNPRDNAAGALRLYQARRWQPWVCQP